MPRSYERATIDPLTHDEVTRQARHAPGDVARSLDMQNRLSVRRPILTALEAPDFVQGLLLLGFLPFDRHTEVCFRREFCDHRETRFTTKLDSELNFHCVDVAGDFFDG
jgi:hypothetical protein